MNERTHLTRRIPAVQTPGATLIVHKVLVLVFLVSPAFYGCGDDTSDATYTAHYEPAPCDFQLPSGQTEETVECGHLIVPEDRSRNDGRTVRLAVAVLKATGEAPASDPFVYLSGGPGSGALEGNMQGYTPEFAAPLQSKRDLVFFDQRGTGRSQPKLDCPEYAQALREGYALHLTAQQEAARQLSALRACHDRLVADGVNLSAYRSSVSAADLQDLMIALGYERWNVYGVSYGTRLAQSAMRETPEHIRSVIFDSTAPVHAPLDANFAADFEHALNRLFAGCANDPVCNASFPDLEQTFFTLINQLNAAPVTLRPVDPVTAEPFDLVLTGDRLLIGIQQAMYGTDLIPFLPFAIGTAAAGDFGLITAGSANVVQRTIGGAAGMTYSVNCGERTPFVTPAIVAQATANVRPEIRDAGLTLITQLRLDVCELWNVAPPAETDDDALASDIPTLILAGEYDPITPPYYGQEVAQTLPRSHYFEFPGFGHGQLRALSAETARPRCAMQLVSAFLDDPLTEPDRGCIETLEPPSFVGN